MNRPFQIRLLLIFHLMMPSCDINENYKQKEEAITIRNPHLTYFPYVPNSSDLIISRSNYAAKLFGF